MRYVVDIADDIGTRLRSGFSDLISPIIAQVSVTMHSRAHEAA